MRIGSIIINGVERVAHTLLREFELQLESGDRMGTARMIVLYNPDDSAFEINSGDEVEIWKAEDSEGGSAATLFGSTSAIFGEPLFGEATPSGRIFAGNVVVVQPQVMVARRIASGSTSMWGEPEFGSPLFGDAPGTERVNCYRLECRDNNYLLEGTIVSGTFTSQTDRAIVLSLFSGVAGVSLSDVASTVTIASFSVVDQTLRAALLKLAELTGAIFYIDADNALHYFLSASKPAAFSMSESPDLATSFPFERETFQYTQEWRSPANRVKVVGAVSTGGVSIEATVNDTASQALYGIKAVTVVDRQITTTSQATARANVEKANRSLPQPGGTLVTYVDGLSVGQYLTIDASTTVGLSGSYTIRRINIRWLNKDTPRYQVEWGAYQPDIARTLRAMYDQAQTPAAVIPTTPAPETVTGGSGGSIVPGSIQNVDLGSAIISQANMQSASIGTAQIQNASIQTAHIQDAQITTVKIGDAQITSAKIVSLDAAKITTGDLIVGGSGNVGMVSVRNAANAQFGWIGKSGSDYGAWFDTLWVSGTGPSNAKLRATGGSLELVLDSGDALTLTTGSRYVGINASGVRVALSSGSTTYSSLLEGTIVTNDGTGAQAIMVSGSSQAYVAADSGGGLQVQIRAISGGTGLLVNGSLVVQARRTGWTAATGTATRTAFATSTATTQDVAERLKALIDDLLAHGLIAA